MDEQQTLSQEELEALRDYARDLQQRHTDPAVLAGLEKRGLLMRGWSNTYVVTARGQEALQRKAS